MNTFYKISKGENTFIKIKKKSEIGFWNYQILGLFSYILNKNFDYLIITNKRILIIVKDEVVRNTIHNGVSKLKFNSTNDTLTFSNENNTIQSLSLKKIRLSYEEIQLIKKKLSKKE